MPKGQMDSNKEVSEKIIRIEANVEQLVEIAKETKDKVDEIVARNNKQDIKLERLNTYVSVQKWIIGLTTAGLIGLFFKVFLKL